MNASPDTTVNVNVNVNWGDLDLRHLGDIVAEMQKARAKYPTTHDDDHGSGHLVKEAIFRLSHMGEFATDEAVKHEIVVAMGLLFNALATIDRAYEDEE